MLHEWILESVSCGVGSRECDRYNKVRRDEPKQYQNEELSLPAREKTLQHRDRSFSVRTLFSDLIVDREGSEKREQNEDQSRHRR
jgi:hypothetical protein